MGADRRSDRGRRSRAADRPAGTGVTLVAFYGRKPPALARLVLEAQTRLREDLREGLDPYLPDQVHATLIGLEGRRIGGRAVQTRFAERQGEPRPIDWPRLLEILRDRALLPFAVRIGGYAAGERYPFTSRGVHPHRRSFSLQGDLAVAMGWPFRQGGYPPTLDRLRRAFQRANALHKYHAAAGDFDNDFFFVLGSVDRGRVDAATAEATRERMRAWLGAREPLILSVERRHLSLVAYRDPRLPPATSRAYGLEDAETVVTEIESLYAEDPEA